MSIPGNEAYPDEKARKEMREAFNEPVAWLHKDHEDAHVITNAVRRLWLKVNPRHVANYTIPLYKQRGDIYGGSDGSV